MSLMKQGGRGPIVLVVSANVICLRYVTCHVIYQQQQLLFLFSCIILNRKYIILKLILLLFAIIFALLCRKGRLYALFVVLSITYFITTPKTSMT